MADVKRQRKPPFTAADRKQVSERLLYDCRVLDWEEARELNRTRRAYRQLRRDAIQRAIDAGLMKREAAEALGVTSRRVNQMLLKPLGRGRR